MQLLDRILAADDQSLWASATIKQALSSCWGIEYLGQATAALFTLVQLRTNPAHDNEPPMPTTPIAGMLIVSRRLQVHQPQLETNRLLLMQVTPRSASTLHTSTSRPGLVKFQGSLWQLESDALSQLPLSTTASRLPYDTATLAEHQGQLIIEGDLSVYISPQHSSIN